MPMILHYLKVAARSLMKYKMQSLISALCLAVGIVCFSYTYRFVETVAPTDYRPHYDRRLNLSLANNGALSSNEIARMEEELRHAGVEDVAAYTKGLHTQEVTFSTRKVRSFPFWSAIAMPMPVILPTTAFRLLARWRNWGLQMLY